MTLPQAPFGRVLTAMVTPFAPDGSLDLDAAARVALHLADHGHDGVVVSGTTGESPTTTTAEDGQLLRAVKEAVGDRLKIVAGVGTNDTRHSVELAQQVNEIGADGVLLVTPYYSKPAAAGIFAHFERIASVSDAPVMLYDVPGRTGMRIPFEVYQRASELPNVIAVKEAVGDLEQGFKLATELGYAVYSGDDGYNLAWLSMGASGVVSVAGHVVGDQLRAMVTAMEQGDLQAAQAAYAQQLPAIDAIMGVSNYGATTAKAALQLLGVLDNRRVRLPQVELTDTEVSALSEGLRAAKVI
ncbi:MAG: 4-hydroxy-tetrahydrodipicolinate synthase [Nocardioidaceae bacterium]|nr:4-hydroxy-tetrahydrodipicolinate synthase [Nocardioidaceae bacterium]MCB8993284.1 4-hydroxy-tetrahydrodipicolinate synthase [Nocardioidaceae bacterium]MCO5324552.1 4-hydroxy-tetrahydrodipicolinate synthase [Nocardioidaceae bacterium]HMU35210.1 4-hydroxy-tetrahydrodipicolinate synthase [Marmoricola sp.]